MKLAVLYAGQGAQHPGMGKEFYEASPAFRAAFDSAALDFDLHRVCFEDPDGVLNQTEYTQPCMVAFACGVTAVLAEKGVKPAYLAGLSLGEYSALQAAGVFTAKQAIELTAFRGKAMAEAAKKAAQKGIIAMNAYQYRRVPAIDLAKKFIDEGAIGKILNVRCTYLQSWSADPASPLSWRFQKDIAGAGTLGDIASHVIDIAQYLAGDIEAVTGMMQTYITERPVQEGGTDLLGTVKLGADAKRKAVDVDDEDSFLVKFKNGAVGSIEATRNAWGRNNFITVELHGTLGSLYFNYERLNELQVCLAGDPDDRRGFKTIYTGPAHFHGEVTWNIPGMNIGYGELKSIESYEFIKAVVEGKQPSTSFAEGYRVERVCDAVKRSAETGRWVTVSD